jgi:hypothetical protein
MTEGTKSDFVSKTVIVPNSGRMAGIVGSLGVFGMMAVVLSGAIYLYRLPIQALAWDEKVTRTEKKHKDILVDVQALPPRVGQLLIPTDSLEDLIKIADALLKPVLHKAEEERHTYCVMDGAVGYEYISEPEPHREQ